MGELANWTEYSRFLLSLLAVLDPFMAVPIFLGMCAHRSDTDRRRFAKVISLTVFGVLVGVALAGEAVLRTMGTSLASFRIGGGLVLLMMAFAMLQAKPGDVRQTAAEADALDGTETLGIVPLAVPLLAGPGAISTVMIAVQQGGLLHDVLVIVIIGAVCAVVWLMLRMAVSIGRLMGTAGLNVANRLLGLLLAAIAVESIAIGLKDLFPVLAGG
ncbi:MAG: multiple antibiotic resistance protein [Rugosibacter sp.]|nr:multiple antibiotic resistance protein [Rugosibacter sp.]